MKLVIPLCIIISLFNCCTPKSDSKTYNGVWQSIGHGEILEIKGEESYAIYDITSISCLPRRKGKLSEIENALSLEADTLSLVIGVITTRYTKESSRPLLCSTPMDTAKVNSAMYNFEVFMETVKEHYAFLQLNDVKWDHLYQTQKSKIRPNYSDVDLFRIIEETYDKLNDNHAYLEASNEVYDLLDEIYPEEIQSGDTLPDLGDFHVAHTVAKHHLKEDMTKDSWLVHWGEIEDNLGYIQLLAMTTFADLTKLTVYDEGWHDAWTQARDELFESTYLEKEIEGVRETMDIVMKDLSEMESIIIDVRFNGGGNDVVSFEILSRFLQGRRQVANHKFSYSGGYTAVDPIYINGSDMPYLKSVYILSSPQTGSAAEVFSIASMSLPHVQRIGSATMGAMSTTLDKVLPNGWEFAVSNEVYMDNSGLCYENIGIPVYYELNYPKDRQAFFRSVIDDLDKDKKEILLAVENVSKK